MNKLKLTIILIAASLLMTACEDQEKNKLDNRVIDFWNHKIERDFSAAHKFLSPGWKKNESEVSFIQRMNRSTVSWLNVKIKEKQCSEKYLCTVIVGVEYEYQFKGSMGEKIRVPSQVTEKWLMKDNIWYNVPIKSKVGQK